MDYWNKLSGALASGDADSFLEAISKNRYKKIPVKTKEEKYRFVYSFLHSKNLFSPEVSVFNKNAAAYETGFLFPRDIFIAEDAKRIMEASVYNIGDVLDDVLGRDDVLAVCFVAGLDESDGKRISFYVTGSENVLVLNYCGGVTDEEYERPI